MFCIKRDGVQELMGKIHEGREKIKIILEELYKERDEKKADMLRTLYKEELERSKQTWHAYKQTLGKQSQLLFNTMERGHGTKIIPSFKAYLEKNVDEAQKQKKIIHSFEDYVWEWEEEKQKERHSSVCALHDIFTYLVKKDKRFIPYLSSQVEVKNYTTLGYAGDYEEPTPVYKKKMVVAITDFIRENHPVLQFAKRIVLTLEARYCDVDYEVRDHRRPYYLYEEVKEKGLDYQVTITLNSGSELKVNQYAVLFEDWGRWANEESENEADYAEALKEWYLGSALQEHQQSMNSFYHCSALNGLADLLEQKETRHYVLAYSSERYVILSVHPTHGQIWTDFRFDATLSFLEPGRNLETFENLLYILTLFNGKDLILFPSEAEQITLLESFA